MRIIGIILLVVKFSVLGAHEYLFRSLTSTDGLSQNDVLDIHQDHRGFMWFSTYDGLNRYDGYSFKPYQSSLDNPYSISSNLTHSITEDPQGNLWITLDDAGICRFNPVTENFTRFPRSEAEATLFNDLMIDDIVALPDGSVWFNTSQALYRITSQQGMYNLNNYSYRSDSLPIYVKRPQIRDLFKASDTCLWVISYGGIDVIWLNRHYEPTGRTETIHFGDNLFETATACPEGYVVALQCGLILIRNPSLRNDQPKIEYFSKIVATALNTDLDTNLWVGSTHGIYLFQRKSGSPFPYQPTEHFTSENSSLTTDIVNAIFRDATGILWFGTKAGGVSVLNPRQNRFYHVQHIQDTDLKSYRIKLRAIHQDKEQNIWLGTDNHDLFLLPSPGNFPNFNAPYIHFEPNKNSIWHSVYSIADVQTPNIPQIWAGCGFTNTLVSLNKVHLGVNSGITPIASANKMHMNVLQTSDSLVWLAIYTEGLGRYDPFSEDPRVEIFNSDNTNLPSDVVRSLMEDDEGQLWIGTGNGLCVLPVHQKDKANLHFIVYQHSSTDTLTISHNYILRVMQTLTGQIWIGTLGGGLNHYIAPTANTPEHFRHITTRQGLPNNNIKEILEDHKGNLWIASNKGLTRYNPYSSRMNNYDSNDGLQDNEFGELAGCKLATGQLLFGGVNGFNAFFPKDIQEDTTQPKVVITRLQLFNTDINVNDPYNGRLILSESIDQTSSLRLKYTENSLTIHFSALHYASPQKNKYKYKLDGFDTDWNSTNSQSRFARYTNLEPGKYRFNVLGSNSDGIWSKTPKTITLHIVPPIWQTLAFRLIATIIAVLTLVLFFRYRLQQLRSELANRKEQEQLLTEAKIKAEESNNLKSSILANLSHEIRTPINGINGFAQILVREGLSPDRRKQYSDIIKEKSNELLAILDSILNVSAVHSGSIQVKTQKRPLGTSLMEANLTAKDKVMAENKPIRIILRQNLADLKQIVDTDHYKVLIVLNNLLDNAIKFTEQGEIRIGCSIKNSFIEYSISDTGIGIAEGQKDLIFDEFRQGSTGHTRKYEGLGLGLALCRSYVVILGGKIWLESEEGKGSTFYFTIPYKPG